MNATIITADSLRDFVRERVSKIAWCVVLGLPIILFIGAAFGMLPLSTAVIGLGTTILVGRLLYKCVRDFLLTSVRMNAMLRVLIVVSFGVVCFFTVGTMLWAYLLTALVVWLLASQLCGSVGSEELRTMMYNDAVAVDNHNGQAITITDPRTEHEASSPAVVGIGVTEEDAKHAK